MRRNRQYMPRKLACNRHMADAISEKEPQSGGFELGMFNIVSNNISHI